ncbi:hypothetical protein C8E97_2180 [Saccharothrix australiensis]|uniref:Uncharacterized protein n=2 Tax=Saccharothrix australiensis TaxID=2072 RepID=A0A495W156_9PSEU|nr:hypothetical protein C8E97_2180 [Saccharothrix australiensis]
MVAGGAALVLDNTPSAAAAAEETQSSLVETFDHPGAAAIEERRHIRLKKGDGNIMLVECRANANQIRVESTAFLPPENVFCFQVVGDKGSLTMEIPEAFLVFGNDYRSVASWTTDSGEVRQTVVDRKDKPFPIGEGVTGKPGVLIELTASR